MIRRGVYHWAERLSYRLGIPLRSPPEPARLLGHWGLTGSEAWLRASNPAATAIPVFVITYGREAACRTLIESIAANAPEQVVPIVIDDASVPAYKEVPDVLTARFGPRGRYLRGRHNLGKSGLWMTYGLCFEIARRMAPAGCYFLQDDVQISADFFTRSWELWEAIDDSRKAVLSLVTFPEERPEGQWIRFRRRAVSGAGVWLTGWFDLQCFLAGPRLCDALGHRLFPISPLRWAGHAELSSGVGRQLTLRLQGRGTVYQVQETLAYHGAQPSLMNPQARRTETLDNRP